MTNYEIFKLYVERASDMEVEDYGGYHKIFSENRQGITIWMTNGDVIFYFPEIKKEETNEQTQGLGYAQQSNDE